MSIQLTLVEKKLFHFLVEAAKATPKKPVLRVAGGWVRDKILQGESHDIDIALDSMYGFEFANHAKEFFPTYSKEHKIDSKISNVHKISANPEQSKHLETATVRMFGLDVDFVNLRAEDYTEDSRIPSMRFGSPKEDALRRDLTINALFYNINEEKIEDFTGKGLDDLKNGIIRTPVDPHTTFLDDPLRILRSIRFATRFHYKFDNDLVKAVQLPDVKNALDTKVSRERFGIEIAGALKSSQPIAPLTILYEWQLFSLVFHSSHWSSSAERFAIETANRALVAAQNIDLKRNKDNDQIRLVLLTAAMTPLVGLTEARSKGNKRDPAAQHVIATSLKWSSKDATQIQLTLDTAVALRDVFLTYLKENKLSNIKELANLCEKNNDLNRSLRATLGTILRRSKELYRPALCVAAALDDLLGNQSLLSADGVCNQTLIDSIGVELTTTHGHVYTSGDEHAVSSNVQQRLALIEQLQLTAVWSEAPLVDGTTLIAEVRVPRGPAVKAVLDAALLYQLARPEATRDDVLNYAREWFQQQSK